MQQQFALYVILGMATVTYLSRVLPLWIMSSTSLPPIVVSWLGYVPVAVLSGMLFPMIGLEGKEGARVDTIFLLAAVPTAVVAWKTRSLALTVLVGTGAVALLRCLPCL